MLTKTYRGNGVEFRMPDYVQSTRGLIGQFMPRAGVRIQRKAQAKLGSYQKGWARLAASTVRRKQRRRRGPRAQLAKSRQVIGPAVGLPFDAPLIDTSQMSRRISHNERGKHETIVSAPFPAEIHEQDPEMETIANSVHTPPKRAFLGSAMMESIPSIVKDLESFIGSQL